MNLKNDSSKPTTIYAKRGRNVSNLFFSKIEKYQSDASAGSWRGSSIIDQSQYLDQKQSQIENSIMTENF